MGWSRLKALPAAIWWVAATTLVNRLGSMVFPFLVLYFHRSLHIDLEEAGAIAACFGFGSLVASPLGGWAADRFDAIHVLIAALLTSGVLFVIFPAFSDAKMLALLTFAVALTGEMARPATMTTLARLGGEDSRDAFTLNYLAINLGMSVGPTLGSYLAVYDYRWLFWVDGSSALVAGVLLAFSGTRCPRPELKAESAAPSWNVGKDAWLLFLWVAVTMWIFMGFFAAAPVYVVETLHGKESDCGWIWVLNTLLVVVFTLPLNHWTQGTPYQVLLARAALIFSLTYAALLVWAGLPGLVIATLAVTLGEMLLFPNATAYLQRVVPPESVGRAMGLNGMCVSLSLMLSTPTVGHFFARDSADALWWVFLATGLVAALGFRRLR